MTEEIDIFSFYLVTKKDDSEESARGPYTMVEAKKLRQANENIVAGKHLAALHQQTGQTNIRYTAQGESLSPGYREKRKRKIIIGVAVLILFLCGFTLATGILNLDFYAGGISIESLVITGELSESGDLVSPSQDNFEATGKIYGLITTSGVDATVGMRWYHDDELIYEQLGRPVNNKFATFLEGSPFAPLPAGNYHVEAFIGNLEPIKTARFTVEEFDLVLNVVPQQLEPKDHIDIENSPYVEVPFAFDEVWENDGEEWQVNEVKITFFKDEILFVIVIDSKVNPNDINEVEARELSKPIADYAIQNGYYETAKELEINGVQYNFDELAEPIVVTLFNKGIQGGFRTRFHVSDLSSD